MFIDYQLAQRQNLFETYGVVVLSYQPCTWHGGTTKMDRDLGTRILSNLTHVTWITQMVHVDDFNIFFQLHTTCNNWYIHNVSAVTLVNF